MQNNYYKDNCFVKKLTSILILIFIVLMLGGTKACQQDYDFASKANIGTTGTTTPTDTPETDGTILANTTPTVFGSITVSVIPTVIISPSLTVIASPSPVVTGTVTVSTTQTVVNIIGNTSSQTDSISLNKAFEASNNRNSTNKNINSLSNNNWLGEAFQKSKSSDLEDSENQNTDLQSDTQVDDDKDGYTNSLENEFGTNKKNISSFPKNYLTSNINQLLSKLNDTDLDGLNDDKEILLGTDINNQDSDNDGCSDGLEVLSKSNPLDANSKPFNDYDNDCLSEEYEKSIGTDPYSEDTDGDGLSDGMEVIIHTDPLVIDTDSDGVTDAKEFELRTDPTKYK